MFWYPVQRQRLPSSSARIVFSSALGCLCTRSIALITIPGVQKPHCRPWHSLNAACIGCSVPSAAARPSMVVISAPGCCTASVLQALIARPFTSTVQAPHCAVSQPTCVPVRRRCSRNAVTSSVLAGTSSDADFPFTLNETSMSCSPCGFAWGGPFLDSHLHRVLGETLGCRRHDTKF